jgi:uncharacterized protein involved in tolerance to divalent cations
MKIVISYIDDEKNAEKIAETLLEEKIAACVNIFPCKSRYWWKGKIERTNEFIIVVKTAEDLVDRAMKKIIELHTYEQPVIEVIDVERVNDGVESWISEVTR